MLHQFRRKPHLVRELAEAAIILATDQGFPLWLALGTTLRGWALTEQGQVAEVGAQILQGLAAYRAAGAELWLPYFLALLAEAHGKSGQVEAGLHVLSDALETVAKTEERWSGAELSRLQGQLMLQSKVSRPEVPSRRRSRGVFSQGY